MWNGIVAHYRQYLKIDPRATPVTLHEGNTPLIPLPKLAQEIAPNFKLYIKYEGLNPTGSFKDRGMTAAITQAVFEGAAATICASTGNTAASAAAYSARAGLRCLVLIPEGNVALGKVAGAIAYGAQVIQIKGSFDEALAMVREISQKHPIALVNSINPYRLEGQKTGAFEICDALESAPHWLCLPVGNAGNISAYWMGFKQYQAEQKIKALPRLLGVQAAGAAPLVLGHAVEKPETVATAIKIGRPARGEQALEAAEESQGKIIAVTDDQIIAAWKRLAHEGVFVEPASAAGIAGLIQEAAQGKIHLDQQTVVAIVTGHGLKDPDAVIRYAPKIKTIPAEVSLLEKVISEK